MRSSRGSTREPTSPCSKSLPPDQSCLEKSEVGRLKVGQLAIAVARLSEHGVNASLGMIGGLGGAWRTWRGGQVEQLIRVAITLYPGFSGGALLDAQGR